MPTRRIGDLPTATGEPKPCYDPDHRPPSHMVWPSGVYEHTCPSCGFVTRFVVGGVSWSSNNDLPRSTGHWGSE